MPEINGTSSGETLTGTNDADIIRGNGGNDTLDGGGGDDILEGGDGSDTFIGGSGNDYINGRYGNNDVAIFSGVRANYLIENVVINGLNHARVTGIGPSAGDGVDTLLNVELLQFSDVTIQYGINPNNRPIFGQPGLSNHVILDSALFTYQVPGTAFIDLDQDDVLTYRATLASGAPLPSWLVFNPATRTFSGTPPISEIGLTYSVRVFASDDDLYDPDYEISGSFTVMINQAPGADVVGTAGNDVLSGTFRNERLLGGMGNDILRGSAGADVMDGGGNNWPGHDLVDYSASAAAVTLNLATGTGSGGDAEGDFLNQIEGVIGTVWDDIVTGHLGGDLLYGGLGVDTLNGNSGDDRIFGEAGNDVIDGNENNDWLSGGAGQDVIHGGAGLGADILFSNLQSAGYTGRFRSYAPSDLDLDRGAEADQLFAGDGEDVLFIGYNDSANGGDNSQIGNFYNQGDALVISLQGASSGVTIDFRQSTIANGAGVITGIEHVNFVEGSNFDDVIYMRASDSIHQWNTVYGMAGNDNLNAAAWTTELYGGDGNDIINARDATFVRMADGGAGNDIVLTTSSTWQGSYAGGTGYDILGVAGDTNDFIALSGFEYVDLVNGARLFVRGAQFNSGFALDTGVGGDGSIVVYMETGQNFVSKFFSFFGNVSISVLGTNGLDVIKAGDGLHVIDAGDGTDVIRGGNLVDTINGGTGIDKISGGGGADILTGGAGGDVFKYGRITDSGTGASADRITDFAIGSDRLNFVRIDTNPNLAGSQGFAFVGTAAFGVTGQAQIRYMNSGTNLLVQADVNGDGAADMEIILQGLAGQTLTASSFNLGSASSEPLKGPDVMDALALSKSADPPPTLAEIAPSAFGSLQSEYISDGFGEGVQGLIRYYKNNNVLMGPLEII
jgi:Ca2+-binding RTX toxin-like protein